ncbi:hypothetical protein GCM10010269_31360 [Streptomyces humidus]|uniref:Helix-turn-helix domain-containing protein n=1 Tax=Streptomyces humidus TaxID=52259 RepID=A0A918L3R2_9ACTN|nr:helix-turn-helix domain-containing protein [Streptomyces humidus]GGR89976.1 hypothetical protein GCM10010269_31360 [Streptomyces humidus]
MAEVTLTDDERETLVRWSRRATSAQALAQRCRIVLGCAEGKPNQQVAAELGIWPQTVGKWRRRFPESRLDGLGEEPRPGAPRKISDEQVEAVVVATLERTPKDATHWSRASMAAESGLIWGRGGERRTARRGRRPASPAGTGPVFWDLH